MVDSLEIVALSNLKILIGELHKIQFDATSLQNLEDTLNSL